MSDMGKGIPPFPTIASQDEIEPAASARGRSNTPRARLARALSTMRLAPFFGTQTVAHRDTREEPDRSLETEETALPETWSDDFRMTLDDLVLEAEEEEPEPVRFPYKG